MKIALNATGMVLVIVGGGSFARRHRARWYADDWCRGQVDEKEQLEKHIAQLERRIRRLEYTQRTLDMHIATLENSLVFRILGRVGSLLHARRDIGSR
jgi:siroheme synthase (precorrin-2 oxidase/ferrochelatase)